MSLHFIFSNKPNPSPFPCSLPLVHVSDNRSRNFGRALAFLSSPANPHPITTISLSLTPPSLDSRSDERMAGHHHRWRRSVTATEPPQRQRSCGWRFSGGCGQEMVVTGSGSGDNKDDGSAVLFR
ncbi:hypothetical protein Hanom_Chr04g00333281 [Helianthus anomalus]